MQLDHHLDQQFQFATAQSNFPDAEVHYTKAERRHVINNLEVVSGQKKGLLKRFVHLLEATPKKVG